jgi:hypothetical protein
VIGNVLSNVMVESLPIPLWLDTLSAGKSHLMRQRIPSELNSHFLRPSLCVLSFPILLEQQEDPHPMSSQSSIAFRNWFREWQKPLLLMPNVFMMSSQSPPARTLIPIVSVISGMSPCHIFFWIDRCLQQWHHPKAQQVLQNPPKACGIKCGKAIFM